MFPVLEPGQIDRLRRFAEPRSFSDGERLVSAGETASAMYIILKGEVIAKQRDDIVKYDPFVTVTPGMCIMLMVLSANLLGDWLRVKLDPQLRQL